MNMDYDDDPEWLPDTDPARMLFVGLAFLTVVALAAVVVGLAWVFCHFVAGSC